MLAVLLAAQRCYKQDSVLVGDRQRRVFELTLVPEDDATCAVFDGKASECFLQYYDGTQLLNVSAPYQHSATKPIVISFDLNAQPAVFQTIQVQKRISYSTVINGAFTPAAGAVSYINHKQMDSTQCWSSLIVKFDSTVGAELVAVRGTPLDCQVTKANAKFQFWDIENNAWANVTIYGYLEAGENPDTIFVADKPFSGAYTFQSILLYRESVEHLAQMIEDEQNGAANQAKLDQYAQDQKNIYRFIQALVTRKQTQSRLYLEVPIRPASSSAPEIIQDIIGDSTGQLSTYSSGCFELASNYFYPGVYARDYSLSFDFMRSYYAGGTGCVQGEKYQVQLYYKVEYVNGTVYENTSDYANAPTNDLRAAPGFTFSIANLDIDHIKSMLHTAFFRVNDEDGSVKSIQAITGSSKLACITHFHMEYGVGQACVRLQFNNSDRCKLEAKNTYLGFLMNEKTSKGYECFSFDIEYRDSETVFCTKRKYRVVFGLDIGGDDASRYKQFKADYQQNDGGMVIGFIGGSDMIINRQLTFKRVGSNLIGFYIAAAITVVAVLIGFGIALRVASK